MSALFIIASFALGSIPFGVVMGKLRGVDIRSVGSGNIGATNAARALGKKIGVLVLLLDTGKAWAPVFLARRIFSTDANVDWIASACGLAAFLGHCYSPWLKFKGGKGVASALGAFLALAPIAAAIAAAIWVTLYALTRISSIGSLAATTAFMPILYLRGEPRAFIALAFAMWAVILWRHRANIRRLLRREEGKV